MNRTLVYILAFLFFSCVDNKNKTETQSSLSKQIEKKKTIFDIVFRDIHEIKYFKNYKHRTSTIINYEEDKWDYAFVEMVNKNNRIVILEKIIETKQPQKKFQIIDTIHINNLKKHEFLSFGLCMKNRRLDSEIFTLIEGAESELDLEYYSKIKIAWKANLTTKKIEKMSQISGIKCKNESYGI